MSPRLSQEGMWEVGNHTPETLRGGGPSGLGRVSPDKLTQSKSWRHQAVSSRPIKMISTEAVCVHPIMEKNALIFQHLSNQLCRGCHVTKVLVGGLAIVARQNSCLSTTAQLSLRCLSAWSVMVRFFFFDPVRPGVVCLILDYFGVLLGVVTV